MDEVSNLGAVSVSRKVQYPKHVSKSSLTEYMGCGYKWYLSHVLKVPQQDSTAFAFGSAYHAVQHSFFAAKKAGKVKLLSELQILYERTYRREIAQLKGKSGFDWDRFGLKDEVIDENVEKGKLLVEAYYPVAQEIKVVDVERGFEFPIPGLDWKLKGYIDLVQKVDDDYVVIDHKTAASSPCNVGDEESLLNWQNGNWFNIDVACYALACKVLYGVLPVRFEYHTAVKTKVPKIVKPWVDVDQKQLEFFMEILVEQVKGIERRDFRKNTEGRWCSPAGCDYWERCHFGVPVKSDKKMQIEVVDE